MGPGPGPGPASGLKTRWESGVQVSPAYRRPGVGKNTPRTNVNVEGQTWKQTMYLQKVQTVLRGTFDPADQTLVGPDDGARLLNQDRLVILQQRACGDPVLMELLPVAAGPGPTGTQFGPVLVENVH